VLKHLLQHKQQLRSGGKFLFGALQATAHVVQFGLQRSLGYFAENTRGIGFKFRKGYLAKVLQKHTAGRWWTYGACDHFNHDAAKGVYVAAFAHWFFGVCCLGRHVAVSTENAFHVLVFFQLVGLHADAKVAEFYIAVVVEQHVGALHVCIKLLRKSGVVFVVLFLCCSEHGAMHGLIFRLQASEQGKGKKWSTHKAKERNGQHINISICGGIIRNEEINHTSQEQMTQLQQPTGLKARPAPA
jgi:hypothetical protein